MAEIYQPDYAPSPLSESERRELVQRIMQGRGNLTLALSEVERVGRNMRAALENRHTRPQVRKAIVDYVQRLMFAATSERAIVQVYTGLCVGISQIPFVPDVKYIEALTGQDEKLAKRAARLGRENFKG